MLVLVWCCVSGSPFPVPLGVDRLRVAWVCLLRLCID